MWTYYRDVTLYAFASCVFFGLVSLVMYDSLSEGIIVNVIIFGIFGTGLGILAFNYFQKQQYYMYHNLGFTKRFLIMRTWFVNLCLSVFLLLIISFFI